MLSLSLLNSLSATDYYVSTTTGNDINPGTFLLPWKTIQKACENASAGSTVYIMAGTYFEQLYMDVSGNELDGYITFTSFESGTVTIDGSMADIMSPTVLLNIQDRSYIRIQNLNFANATSNFSIGIIVQGACDHIDIMNNDISNIHFSSNAMDDVTSETNVNPLIIYGNDAYLPPVDMLPVDPAIPTTNINIVGNSIHDCRTGYSEALTVNGNVDGFSVVGNSVYNITNIGIDLAGGYGVSTDPTQDFARNGVVRSNTVYNCNSSIAVAAGIYADGSRDIVIEQNNVHDCGRGYEVGCEVLGHVASNIIVRSNVAWHNREAGIGIGGYDYPDNTGKVVSCKILNNTCYGNDYTNVGNGELLIEYTEDCVIKNNIFYATNPLQRLLTAEFALPVFPVLGPVLDYNIYYHDGDPSLVNVRWNSPTPYVTFPVYQAGTLEDANSQFIDPRLVDPLTQNFHLGPNSPAFDASDPLYMPMGDLGDFDFDGELRLTFAFVDIGADESNISLPVDYVNPLQGNAMEHAIELRWTTALERGSKYFDIERSTNGSRFGKIGQVAAQGNSNVPRPYVFQDKNPGTGTNYYRLQQVDFDGRSAQSNVVAIAWNKAADFRISPNPASDIFVIKSDKPWEKAVLKNAQGQTVHTYFFTDQLIINGLQSGVYWLEVFATQDATPQVLRLIKS